MKEGILYAITTLNWSYGEKNSLLLLSFIENQAYIPSFNCQYPNSSTFRGVFLEIMDWLDSLHVCSKRIIINLANQQSWPSDFIYFLCGEFSPFFENYLGKKKIITFLFFCLIKIFFQKVILKSPKIATIVYNCQYARMGA